MNTAHRRAPRRALALLVSCVMVLGACAEESAPPTTPAVFGPAYNHSTGGSLLTGTGTTNVLDNGFTAGDWSGAGVKEVVIGTARGTTTGQLRVMNDRNHLFISLRTASPISGSNQDVLTLQLERNGKVNSFGLRFGIPFDHYCAFGGDAAVDCAVDAVSNTAGTRFGTGGGTTYELRFPLVDDAAGHDLALRAGMTVNFRLTVAPGGNAATTAVPATGWDRIRIATENPDDDPLLPNVEVLVNAPVTVVMRSDDDYRLTVAQAVVGSTTQFSAMFYDIAPGSRPVFSALSAPWFTQRSERLVAPIFTSLPSPQGVDPRLQGVVFVQSADPLAAYEIGSSAALRPENLYTAYANRKALLEDAWLELTLQRFGGKAVSCQVPPGIATASVFAIYPLDPSRVPRPFSVNAPGLSPAASNVGGGCNTVVSTDELVVFKGRSGTGQSFSGSLAPGEEEVSLYPDPNCFLCQYVVDPLGDGLVDLGTVTYGLLRNEAGEQTNTFAVNWKVRGLEDGISRSQLELLYVPDGSAEQTARVLITCRDPGRPTLAGCVLQTSEPRSIPILGVISGEVDDAGNGWVQVLFDFTGVNQARLRIRSALTGLPNDFAPDQSLTNSTNIVGGYAVWTRTYVPGTSWDIAF